MMEEILTIGKVKEYELVIVGKRQQHLASTTVAKIRDSQHEHAGLGPIGDFLSSSGQGIMRSVLVIHNKDFANSNETALRKIARDESTVNNDAITGMESSV